MRWDQIQEGIVRLGDGRMHVRHHGLVLMWAGDGEDARVGCKDAIRLDAEAAGDDDLAILVQRLADGGKGLRLGAVEEAAGIDDHRVGVRIGRRELIAFRAELRDDALGIDQRLGAAEADETNSWRASSWRGDFRRAAFYH